MQLLPVVSAWREPMPWLLGIGLPQLPATDPRKRIEEGGGQGPEVVVCAVWRPTPVKGDGHFGREMRGATPPAV